MNVKIFGRCFSVALYTWSLILSSLPMAASAQTTNEKPLTAQECDSGPNSPYQWNTDLNRCMLKADSTAAREKFESCQALEGQAQLDCLKQTRANYMNEDSMDHDQYKTQWLGTLVSGVNGIAVAHTLFQTIGAASKKEDPGAQCMSRKIMMGAGIASFVGELYLRFMVKDGFDKLSKDYETSEADIYQKQVEAFDYLEAEQEAISEYAKKHETAYNLYALAYGAAAVTAAIELTVGTVTGTPMPCFNAQSNEKGEAVDDEKTETDHGKKLKDDRKALAEAKKGAGEEGLAKDAPEATNVANAEAALGAAAGQLGITQMLGTSMGILVLGGVSGVLTKILANGAAREKEKAKNNAKLVRSAKSKFEKTMAASSFCRSRDDLTQPRCYCYTAEGDRNSERTRSETCQALWAKQDRNLFAEAADYGGKKAKKEQGCYRLDGIYDPNCKCRQMKNEKGDNGCFKVPVTVNQIASAGPGIGLPQVIDSLNQLYGGGLASGQLAPGQIGQRAARMNTARKQLLEQVKKDPKNSGSAGMLNEDQFIAALAKKMPPAAYKAMQSLYKDGVTPSAPVPPAQLANRLESVRKDAGLPSVQTRGRTAAKKSTKKVGFDLYGKEETKDATTFMDKKYDYTQTQNDIVEREDVSIWQVISNRYTVTGLRRLFDDGPDEL